MKKETLRTCPACGCKRRRILRTIRELWYGRWFTTVTVRCRNAGCGQLRMVELKAERGSH